MVASSSPACKPMRFQSASARRVGNERQDRKRRARASLSLVSRNTFPFRTGPHAHLTTSKSEIGYRNRHKNENAADRGSRERAAWHRCKKPRALWPLKAKVSMEYIKSLKGKKTASFILVTRRFRANTCGQGKTTTTVVLADALNHIGKKGDVCAPRGDWLGPLAGERACRRRLCPSRADGRRQPALHRRNFHAITSRHDLLFRH